MIYLFVWETTFARKTPEIRPKGEGIPEPGSEAFEMKASPQMDTKLEAELKKGVEVTQIENLSPTDSFREPEIPERKLTWKEQRVVFRGRITQRKLLQAFFQPFPLLLFPSVLFATFVNGAFMTWLQISGLLK